MTRAAFVLLTALAMACGTTSIRVDAPPQNPSPQQNATVDAPPQGPRAPSDFSPAPAGPGGNTRIPTFAVAKKELARIYVEGGALRDLYCGCPFAQTPGGALRVDLAACGYVPVRDAKRAARVEWEHAVPASAFGRSFAEWRHGSDRCVDKKGKRTKGRTCARTASPEFARMEADLHNLFPVVGEVNGLRSDLPMGVLDPPDRLAAAGADPISPATRTPRTPRAVRFDGCASTIEAGAFVPRPEVRGDLARAYKYMDAAYPGRGVVDESRRALLDRWDREDPPDAWERGRNARIAERQGNRNDFIR
jgi:deoxyribonuclease I